MDSSAQAGKRVLAWDTAGRLAKDQRWIDGTAYLTETKFDALDRVYQLLLPDNETLTHTYGAHGLLTQLTSSLGPTLVSGVQYNVLDLPTQYTLGSGTTAQQRHSYFGLDGVAQGTAPYGALKTLQLQKGMDPMLVNRELGYDATGNVTSVNDLVNGENVGYFYNDLDRLTSAGAPLNETYQYNTIGNLTSKNGQAYTYGDAAHKHAVTAALGLTYGYDANGSLSSRVDPGPPSDTRTWFYDPERRPVRTESTKEPPPYTLWRAAYDGDGVRRKRVDDLGTIHYAGNYERNVGNGKNVLEVITKYYLASFGTVRRLIALRRNGTLSWVGTDHLGSTIRVADATFAPVDGMRYTPFGVSRDSGSNLQTDHKFTGQIEDAAVGLYWYASRHYDAGLARHPQPDSVMPRAGNPQSLNRYSYALNNPLRYVDSTGRWPEDVSGAVQSLRSAASELATDIDRWRRDQIGGEYVR